MRLTGVVARVIMDRWSGMMKRRMTMNKMEYFLQMKYVDDVYVFLRGLRKGMRYNEETKMVEWNEDDEKYDEEEKNSVDYVTMNVWRKMASDIFKFLQFTIDMAEFHKN